MTRRPAKRRVTASLREPARRVPLAGACDVAVAGGGIAGVAAAVAAARGGASVCLLEKTCALGGLATLGNVVEWLPLCDGRGRQVIGGLPEELLKLAVADLRRDNPVAGFAGIPRCWRPGGDPEERKRVRYRAEFNPAAYLLALERFAVEAGVTLLYDTRVCAVRRAARRITHLVVENKSGRGALSCRAVVDATGDADLCWLAGERTEALDSNVAAGWFYSLDAGGLRLHKLSAAYSPRAARVGAAGPFFRGDTAEQVTGQVLASRALIRAELAALRARHPEDDVQVFAPPAIPCLRMTRRLVGAFSLAARHRHRWFADTVGLTGDWRRPGPVYALPWRTLRGVACRNLLAAGRCLSVETSAWDVTRAIPACALTGAVAGFAAALAARETDGDTQALPVPALQHHLRRRGILLDRALVRPAARPAEEQGSA